MSDAPSTVNQAAKTTDEIIHGAIFDVALDSAKTYLVAQAPFLGLPGIKQILNGLLNIVGNAIYKAISNFATFQIIDLQVGSEKSAYAKAESALRSAHLSGDPNALDQATADYKKTLASLIHFDGSYTP